MPVICKFPQSGRGGQSNSILKNIKLYTQLTEPKEKYGIWIKTNTKCKNILSNQKLFEDDGKWGDIKYIPCSIVTDHEVNAIVYRNEIYVYFSKIKSGNGPYCAFYKFDGTSWTLIDDGSIIPYGNGTITFAIHNDYIHLITPRSDSTPSYKHYKFKNGIFTLLNNKLDYNIILRDSSNNIIEYDGKLQAINKLFTVIYNDNDNKFIAGQSGDYSSCGAMYQNIDVYDGKIFTSTYDHYRGISYYEGFNSNIVQLKIDAYKIRSYNNGIALFYSNKFYMCNTDNSENYTTTLINNLPFVLYNGGSISYITTIPIFYNGSLYLFGGQGNLNKYCKFTASEKRYDNGTLIIQKGRTSVHGRYLIEDANGFKFTFDDLFYYGNNKFEWNDEMYIGNGTEWIRIK